MTPFQTTLEALKKAKGQRDLGGFGDGNEDEGNRA
jgi:hypothetical protein